MTILTTLYAFLILGGFLLAWRVGKIGRRPKSYPPGPPTLPMIGNLHQMPREKGHLQFQKWSQEYGPIYSLILGSQVMIVLNSEEVVKDLLDKRGSIYSSRPDLYVAQDILSGGMRFALMVSCCSQQEPSFFRTHVRFLAANGNRLCNSPALQQDVAYAPPHRPHHP